MDKVNVTGVCMYYVCFSHGHLQWDWVALFNNSLQWYTKTRGTWYFPICNVVVVVVVSCFRWLLDIILHCFSHSCDFSALNQDMMFLVLDFFLILVFLEPPISS